MRLHKGTHNVFFCVQPTEEKRDYLCCFRDDMCRRYGIKGSPVRRDCFHVSLFRINDFRHLPKDEIDRAMQTAAVAASNTTRFDVSFNRLVSWDGAPGQRPLVLLGDDGIYGLDQLRRELHRCLANAFMTPRKFDDREPHLTLLRGGNDFPEMIVPEIRWTVREFVLVDSRVGEGRYDILGRWPLTQ